MRTVRLWIQDRLPFGPVFDFLSQKLVPTHRHSFWYVFGGLALFFFLIQVVTGMLLVLYYSPTPDTAHESVQHIMSEVSYGWLIRSVHSWSANLMVAVVLIHLFSTFFMKAYRRPREVMWVSGTVLLFLVLGFAFTGYLLPWDTTAYFATQIGTEIPRSIPVLGDLVVNLLRGGEYIAEDSLKRLYALHVVILPLITLLVVGFHLVLNQAQGTSVPIGIEKENRGIPFFPNYVFRDLISWTIGLLLLVWLTLLFPVQLGSKVDPLSSAPIGIKPEWYFLPLYQTIRMVPPMLFGLSGEMLVNLGVIGFVALLVLLPFLDRKAANEQSSKGITIVGVVAILYLAITITLAYTT